MSVFWEPDKTFKSLCEKSHHSKTQCGIIGAGRDQCEQTKVFVSKKYAENFAIRHLVTNGFRG
jgi:hypothetical protein